MKFQLTIIEAPTKTTPRRTTVVEGRDRRGKYISAADLQNVVEVEQYLEKLYGHRFHIAVYVESPNSLNSQIRPLRKDFLEGE